jgi:hypothetical protein
MISQSSPSNLHITSRQTAGLPYLLALAVSLLKCGPGHGKSFFFVRIALGIQLYLMASSGSKGE